MSDDIERGWISGENQYIAKTKDEIREIALGAMTGQIFGSWQMRESELRNINLVFLPLTFVDDLHVKGWSRDEIVHLYGHMKDSLSRSINGMPIFHSFQVINQTDLDRVTKMQKMIQSIEEDA